mgnify:FL=1
MLKSAKVVVLAVPPPLFRGEARDVVQDERFVVVYNIVKMTRFSAKLQYD